MKKLKIFFKTRGGHKEGMGDMTSSLAIAEELRKKGHDITFIINNNKSALRLVSKRHFKKVIPVNGAGSDSALRQYGIDIAVINQLDTPLSEVLLFKKHANMVVSIEDSGNGARASDIRFNVLYPRKDAITGSGFMPLADSFRIKHRLRKKINKRVKNILVMQGGSDTYGFTPKILTGLKPLDPSIGIDVVLGSNFKHDERLLKTLGGCPRQFNIIRGLDDLSGLMMKADLAISAGGNTLFELACLGVPTIVVCGERFEVPTAERLSKKGFGLNLGFGSYVKAADIYKASVEIIQDFSGRMKMSRAGKRLVDGKGAERIAAAILGAFRFPKREEVL